MTDPNRALAAAHAAMQAGRLDEARAALVSLSATVPAARGPAQHLLALVERRRGDTAAAARAFDTAVRLIPRDPQLHNNRGNFLDASGDRAGALAAYAEAVRLKPDFADAHCNRGIVAHAAGDHALARAALERAVAIDPRLARAWSALGMLLRDLGERDAAEAALARALALAPGMPRALAARALLGLERGAADTVARFRAARAAAPEDRNLLLRETAARLAAGDPAAEAPLAAAVAADPGWIAGQEALARLRFEAGEGVDSVRDLVAAVKARPADLAAWLSLVALEGAMRPAAEVCERVSDARRHHPEAAMLLVADAEFRLRAGAPEDAPDLLAMDLPADARGPGLVTGARLAIRLGAPERAAAAIAAGQAAERAFARDMGLWALLETAWRMTADPRHAWLTGHPGLWGAHRLALDPASIARIADHLRALHRARAHPPDQSLRGGTQTEGTLFWRADPTIRQLEAAIAEAVSAHAAGLPAPLPGHPTLGASPAARAGWRFTGSWSVRLAGAGFHVAHVHPEGWLSSAAYLALPALSGEEGQLVLGEPPAELETGLAPLARIAPEPGLLALFPSWLWHGTRPFAAGERLTVAFDVVPGA